MYSTPVGGGKTTSFLLLLAAYVIESERFGFDKRIRDQTISTKTYSGGIPRWVFSIQGYQTFVTDPNDLVSIKVYGPSLLALKPILRVFQGAYFSKYDFESDKPRETTKSDKQRRYNRCK